jgi:3-deoxy-D-manno-octulosonic-acid transferase
VFVSRQASYNLPPTFLFGSNTLRYLYIILFYLALPFIFLRLLVRSRARVEYRKRWSERLGFFPEFTENVIWIHAASVGETLAAIPLIKALQATYPQLPVLVTNMTITGAMRTKAAFGNTVLHSYIPYDLPGSVARFLNRTRPVVAIIFETELWPNLFAACHARKVPLIIANARLSEKSAAGYHRISSITRGMLQNINTLAVQTQTEAERFIALGLPAKRAIVTGNIKFDIELPKDLQKKSHALKEMLGERLVWVAASTHEGEEEIVLAAHKEIQQQFPDALLILAPRHPERFNAVNNLVKQQGFTVIRRSEGIACTPDTQVYLGDTMGELLMMYAVCDVAFIGGSFAPVGGHNMLEAAVQGKPVITGHYLFNFSEISQSLIAANGMQKVEEPQDLGKEILRVLADENLRNRMGENARQFVAANRGALAKQFKCVRLLIDERLQKVS